MRYSLSVTKSKDTSGAFIHLSKGKKNSYIGMFFFNGTLEERFRSTSIQYYHYHEILNKIFGIFLWENYHKFDISALFADFWDALRAVSNGQTEKTEFKI